VTPAEHAAIAAVLHDFDEVAHGLEQAQRALNLWLRAGAEVVTRARRLMETVEVEA